MTEQQLYAKYTECIKKRDFMGALAIRKKIEEFNRITQETECIAVSDMFNKMTPEQRSKAAIHCNKATIFADLMVSEAVELQAILHKVDPTASLQMTRDVNTVKNICAKLVRNVDQVSTSSREYTAEEQARFSESFGNMCDAVAEAVDTVLNKHIK